MSVLCEFATDKRLFVLEQFAWAKRFFCILCGKLIGFIKGRHIFRCRAAKNAGRNGKQIRLLFGTTCISIVSQKHGLRSDAHSITVDHCQ